MEEKLEKFLTQKREELEFKTPRTDHEAGFRMGVLLTLKDLEHLLD